MRYFILPYGVIIQIILTLEGKTQIQLVKNAFLGGKRPIGLLFLSANLAVWQN